jgi:DNA-directed RNA polymerase specialized sigma24 family protein
MPSFDYAPSKGRFRGWICRIAGNTAKNFLRDKGPVPMSLSSGEWDGEDLLDYSVEPEVEALAREEWERYLPELALKNISGKLDKKTIKVFTMFSNGISASDIAKRLELSENSVYVYKQRVIEKMTAEIARLKNEF